MDSFDDEVWDLCGKNVRIDIKHEDGNCKLVVVTTSGHSFVIDDEVSRQDRIMVSDNNN